MLVVLRYKRKKTSRLHLFILHLSCADLLVAFFNILPQAAWDMTFRFRGNDFICRTVKYLQVMVMYLSTYMLVCTAADRYRAIVHPASSSGTWRRGRAYFMVGAAYGLSCVLSIPQVLIFQMRPVSSSGDELDCWAAFSPEWTVTLYTTYFFFSVYILPLIVISFLYGRICLEVWRYSKHEEKSRSDNKQVTYKFNGSGGISIIQEKESYRSEEPTRNLCSRDSGGATQGSSETRLSSAKLKTIKLTFVIVLAYIMCWSPFFVTQMWWAYDKNAPHSSEYESFS